MTEKVFYDGLPVAGPVVRQTLVDTFTDAQADLVRRMARVTGFASAAPTLTVDNTGKKVDYAVDGYVNGKWVSESGSFPAMTGKASDTYYLYWDANCAPQVVIDGTPPAAGLLIAGTVGWNGTILGTVDTALQSPVLPTTAAIAAAIALAASALQASLVTTVGDPGSDDNVPSEKAVRDAIGAIPGGGDMLKSVYDTNDDGTVDSADAAASVPWSGVTDTPAAYPPDLTGVGPEDVGAEAALGNPGTDDYLLSSKTDGTRSWVAAPSGAVAPHSTDKHTDLAKNDATSDFPNHIFGYLAGTIRADNAAYGISAGTANLNSGNGAYVLYWESVGGVQLAYDASSVDAPAGSLPLHSFVVSGGEITTHNDLRTWLNLDGGGGSGDATSIQGVAVSDTAPTDGQVLAYNGTSEQWEATDPAGGSGSTKVIREWAAGSLDFDYAATPSLDRVDGTYVRRQRLRFDDTTEEFSNTSCRVPSNLDSAGTVTFFARGAAVTHAASKNVQLKCYYLALAHDEAGDAAFGSKASGNKAISGTAGDIDIFEWTETVSNLGWAAGDSLDLKWSRIDASADDLSGDYGVYAFGIVFPVTG